MKPTKLNPNEVLPDHINEYFADSSQSKEVITSKELFRAQPADVDIKTDIDKTKVMALTTLFYNNEDLKAHGLAPVYDNVLDKFMRLRISLDRKSRSEFVDMNRAKTAEDTLGNLSNVKNILTSKQ